MTEKRFDLDALVDTGQWISAQLGRRSSSRAGNALAAKRAPQEGAPAAVGAATRAAAAPAG